MEIFRLVPLISLTLISSLAAETPKPAASSGAVDRLQFFPAPGREQAMVGGRVTGSNVSDREGFEPIPGAEIRSAPPAAQWSEIRFANTKRYRWIRYEAPPGSHGNVAEVEFYSGERLLPGRTFGSFGWRQLRNWPRAFDKDTSTYFDSDIADGQYVGLDVGETSTPQMPHMDPPPDKQDLLRGPVDVTLRSATPGTVIRYAFDGVPDFKTGWTYDKPIHLDHLTTIFAVSLKEGMPPSPIASGTYPASTEMKPGFCSLHVGNSLTASTRPFADYARAAGYHHDYHALLKDGGSTPNIWDNLHSKNQADWDDELKAMPRVDHFTVQPRLSGFTEADLAKEADFDTRFFFAVRAKSPEVQPWIYSEWPSRRPGFNGWVPPFTTYGEACAGLMQCSETIVDKVNALNHQGKPARILPCTLAVAHLMMRLENGEIPGLSARDFDPIMFYDNVHPGDPGRYLLCMVWFSAFYGESPVGKVPSVFANLAANQAAALQQLAWDVVKNYPGCGLYEEGKAPCAQPEFIRHGNTVAFRCATAGAWFRYTLDGSTPSRTHGYIFCGPITTASSSSLKAVAYKSGMADSAVVAQSAE